MNFLKLSLKLQTFFFLGLSYMANCQEGFFNNLPEPIVSQVTPLPTGFLSDHGNILNANDEKILLLSGKSLWIFDGINWENITLPEKPIYKVCPNGIAYISYSGIIESFKFTDSGLVQRDRVLDASGVLENGFISSITIDSVNNLYFTSKNRLWKYSNEIELIDSSFSLIRILNSNEGVFYTNDSNNIYSLGITESNSIEKKALIGKTAGSILQIITVGDLIFGVSSGNAGFLEVNSKSEELVKKLNLFLKPLNTRIKKTIIKGNRLFILTDNGKVAELDFTDENINLLKIDNRIDRILDLLPFSPFGSIALTQTAIYGITNPKFSGCYTSSCGLMGKPLTILQKDKYIYCATSDGLYWAKYDGDPSSLEFKITSLGYQSVLALYSHSNVIYAVSKRGVYKINELIADLVIRDHNLINPDLFSFSEIDNRLWILSLQGKELRLQCLSDVNQESQVIHLPSGIADIDRLRYFNGNIMISSITGAWFILDTSDSKEWIEINSDNLNDGIIVFPLTNNSQPYIIENNKLFEFDVKTRSYGNLVLSDSLSHFSPIADYDSLSLLLRIVPPFSNYYTIWGLHKKTDEEYSNRLIPIAPHPSAEAIKQAKLLYDSTLIVLTNTGLHYYTASYSRTMRKPTSSITRVALESRDSSSFIRDGYFLDASSSKGVVSPKFRNLRMVFGANASGIWDASSSNVQFSSYLEGFDLNWTPWTRNNMREINRLKPGTYILKLKTRNYWSQESLITYLPFTIKPYFYETPIFLVLFLLLVSLAIYTLFKWRRYQHAKVRFKLESLINIRTEELVKEKEKTDNLLARVLPKETASELKEKGRVNTQRFQVVTVLFCDIEGFTRITDETNPEALIDQLDRFFLYFDSVVEKYRIEKIKTIGDAYMCAGGIPQKNRTNPVEVVLAALEMMSYMKDLMRDSDNEQHIWELRIGVDTGPVIAGVVGRNKLSYDIWGSTVNTASRMESSGEVGQINISGNTYMLVSDYFDCTYRGNMPIKNKGDIQMYFVKGIKPELSVNGLSIVPNNEFKILIQHIRLGDLEDFILEKLEKGLPNSLYYHNLKHTVDVYTQVELIGRSENVSNEEMLLLRTAALFHDAGHLIDYGTHEEMAVKLAREILPEYFYTDRQIDVISDLIMSTKLPPNPKNLLEEIMCDADLDYLGRTDFIPVSNMLYKELHEHGKVGTLHEWNELQIKFIAKHSYFTKTARKHRNVNKQSQLDKLKNWMDEN
jgi:adenylate cyclase